MDLVILSDTHWRRGLELPIAVRRAIDDADAVLHAGDVTSPLALSQLRAAARTFAVLGNNDLELAGELPDQLIVELDGVRLALVHNSGDRKGRAARLQRRFPDADVVVFGHSHVPIVEAGVGTQLLFNPGSPTQRRLQPACTFGRLHLRDGHVEPCIEMIDSTTAKLDVVDQRSRRVPRARSR
jgi:putative phosphoesterase